MAFAEVISFCETAVKLVAFPYGIKGAFSDLAEMLSACGVLCANDTGAHCTDQLFIEASFYRRDSP